ncbi:nicotinate-nucleotide adenylyltransferase [Rhodoligotrophos appendicifer]|uniref:nicotinate-nucleotide adenylyltransferase n=1 Tax=Rhodoligotrophos appendicifer TaxID=987056 RepID=UPI00117E0E5A|nr:nicotinate-nucleotide adenylyltransferase [Rhodoligotrophos appendicifer]
MSALPLPFPLVYPSMRIGLFGGSFNPAHAGHLAVSLAALKELDLHQLWWMVSPQNPLKDPADTDDFEKRVARAKALALHPRLRVLEIEKRLGTGNTAATLRALSPLLNRARFVWVMGADSFATLHHWHYWLEIPFTLPLAVFDRPGYTIAALTSPAAQRLGRYRVSSNLCATLPDRRAPAWSFLSMRRRMDSSTAIRRTTAAK